MYLDITYKIIYSDSNEDKFISLLFSNLLIKFPDFNYLLNKCIIFGLCGIFTNNIWLDYLDNNKNKKAIFFKVLIDFVVKQINEKNKVLRIITKKEILCSFINFEEEEEDEDLPFSCLLIDSDLGLKVEMALKGNDEIINCDEFKLFYQVAKYIKKYDNETYNLIIQYIGDEKKIDYLLMHKNAKIKYEEKEYFAVRKIVKIKKNMNE